MAAEVYIPSLPFIAHDFRVSSNLTQISIAVFLFGMSIPGIFFGYISDFFGRRKILLIATSISFVGTLLCFIAPNIYILILGRFVQGLGFSGVGSLSRAILRDRMSGVELAKFASNLAMILALVIDLSPFIGGFLQEYFGWRPIFALLLAYNALAIYMSYRFTDNPQTELNQHLNLSRVLHTSLANLKNQHFLKYNSLAALTYSVLMAYLAVASFLFEKVIGISPTEFGTTTLGLSFVYMFGSFLNGRLLRHFPMDRLIANGVILMWLSTLLLVLYATVLPLTYWGLVSFIAVVYIACGSLFSNSSASAFSAIDKNIGSASALYSTMQVLAGAIFTSIISWFHPTTTLPLAILVGIICVVMSWLSNWKPAPI
jgi:Bcr/CflA subfamily drug resistance transporter